MRLNGWYLYDGSIADVLSVVLDDIRKVLDICDLSGLPLNRKKFEVFFVNASEALLPGISR